MGEQDRKICLCFGVSRRKIESWLRVECPKRSGQLSECFGAGTGCGWCRPFLEKLFQAAQNNDEVEIPSEEDYQRQRQEHIRQKKRGNTE
ncbi:MAG: (2Fe-2S)-binding protein [Pirellulaceae bacterium]